MALMKGQDEVKTDVDNISQTSNDLFKMNIQHKLRQKPGESSVDATKKPHSPNKGPTYFFPSSKVVKASQRNPNQMMMVRSVSTETHFLTSLPQVTSIVNLR
jgi:hypothetical protein